MLTDSSPVAKACHVNSLQQQLLLICLNNTGLSAYHFTFLLLMLAVSRMPQCLGWFCTIRLMWSAQLLQSLVGGTIA